MGACDLRDFFLLMTSLLMTSASLSIASNTTQYYLARA
jgi:hypothetical protein